MKKTFNGGYIVSIPEMVRLRADDIFKDDFIAKWGSFHTRNGAIKSIKGISTERKIFNAVSIPEMVRLREKHPL